MAKVLVTGGAGFIGSHIVEELLARGHQPAVLDDLSSGSLDNVPVGVPFFKVDLRDRSGIARVFASVKPDAVCHQAAQMSVSASVREPVFDAEVNALGLLHVLENCVNCGVDRVVFASSGGVLYGDVFEPAGEDTPANPISPYGITKYLGEMYLKFFAREHGIQSIALRYTNVYGPRQNPHGEAGVVAIFARGMLTGRRCVIFGDGTCVRDYVHVSDVARANVLALTKDMPQGFHAMNISTGIGTDVNELCEGIYRRLSQCITDRVIERPGRGPARAGDLQSNLADHSKAKTELGWEPRVGFTAGLAATVDWFIRDVEASRASEAA